MEKFLTILDQNARASLEELSALTGMEASAVAAKIDEYTKAGYIHGYRALVDWERAGVTRVQAIIELRVSPRRDRGFDEIASAISNFEEVDSVSLMSGGFDLALVISGKSFQDIALFVAKRLSPLDGVLSTATHFVLRTYKKDGVCYITDAQDERECQF